MAQVTVSKEYIQGAKFWTLTAYGLIQFWLSSEFFFTRLFQKSTAVVGLLHILILKMAWNNGTTAKELIYNVASSPETI